MKRIAAVTLMLAGAVGYPSRGIAATCESLASLALPNGKITAAQPVAAGAFSAPGARAGRGNAMADLPAFCRVEATLTPSSDSDIKIEVWLPTANWNGKFQAVGNGAWNGAIGYAALAEALRRGYAASSTDTGHAGGSASFALGHPEKLIDFAYRSEHEMTVKAKAIVNAFYGSAPKYSYWNGCSAGGRQALKEAQMFPADFDGIIAGAPGLDWSGRSAQAVKVAQALLKEEARLHASQAASAPRRRAAGMRCPGRRKRRSDRESSRLQIRSEGARMRRRGRPSLPDAGTGRDRAADVRANGQCEDQAGGRGPALWHRGQLDRPGLVRLGARDGSRPLSLRRVQGSRLGD